MPTRNRPRFFRQALRNFLRQTWRSSELVVIDDGEQAVERICRGADRVQYIRLRQPATTGMKMNLGIEAASGDMLLKFDDDDYQAPRYIETAVQHLPNRRRDRTIVAWDCFAILVAGERRLRFSGHGWTVGATLCFHRELWQRCPFRDVRTGYDSWLLRDLRPEVTRICAPDLYVVVRHGGNTWVRMGDGDSADRFLSRLPYHSNPLSALMPREDAEFYRSLPRFIPGPTARGRSEGTA